MVLRKAKAILLIVTVVIAGPGLAGERYMHNRMAGDRAIGIRRRQIVFDSQNRERPDVRLSSGNVWNDNGRHRDRLRYIPQLGQLGRSNGVGGNRIIAVIQAPNAPSDRLGGTYAGSSYAYATAGGTYVVADGYTGFPERERRASPARAKIIDVASGRTGCAYEAGVCVIRP